MNKIICNDENIPIDENLFNKYVNVREIFLKQDTICNATTKIDMLDIDINNKNATEIYHIVVDLFKNNHKQNIFINNSSKIKITNQDLKESINKIFNDNLQNKLLKEHLSVFSNLGNIISNWSLINQTFENKNRSNYNTWNYYFNYIYIGNVLFMLEFDVVSRKDGENHYRIQRLKKADTLSTLSNNDEVDF